MRYFLCLFFFLASFGLQGRAQKRHLRVAIYPEEPFVMYELDSTLYGISIELWRHIAIANDWEYDFVEYEHVLQVFSDLARRRVDICINPLVVSSTRLRQFDFTQPFFISGLGIAINEGEDSQVKSFLNNIFSMEFLALILFVIMIVFVLGTIIWFVEKQNKNRDFGRGFEGILDGIWWSTVTITTVGYGDKIPKTKLGRIISMFWMFASLTLISSFTATVTSNLTIKRLDLGINSIKSLKEAKNIGVILHSNADDYLQKAQIDPSRTFENAQAALEALEKKQIKYFFHNKNLMNYLIKHDERFENLKVLPFTLNKQYFSFVLPRRSPLLRRINPHLVDRINQQQWRDFLNSYNLRDD